jgi:hypothetical protein
MKLSSLFVGWLLICCGANVMAEQDSKRADDPGATTLPSGPYPLSAASIPTTEPSTAPTTQPHTERVTVTLPALEASAVAAATTSSAPAPIYRQTGAIRALRWRGPFQSTEITSVDAERTSAQVVRRTPDALGRITSTTIANVVIRDREVQFAWLPYASSLPKHLHEWIRYSVIYVEDAEAAVVALQFIQPRAQPFVLSKVQPVRLNQTTRGATLSIEIDPASTLKGWTARQASPSLIELRHPAVKAVGFELKLDRDNRLVSTWKQNCSELESRKRVAAAQINRYKAELEGIPSRIAKAESRLSEAREKRDMGSQLRAQSDLSDAQERKTQIPRDIALAEQKVDDADARLQAFQDVPSFSVLVVVGEGRPVSEVFHVSP